ncbi:hypothetical protein OKJ48_41685 [Streptomyces kunmingensis]|uniref:Integral membrane protein n=1 Tax=Streptomyces kunmingensis TaxID=68225 RepID=A0ABU6CPQ8_9ACTN|nr:hypothetical protein [Streptomyces kunmingensis]MEB3966698.1 hypothetical protein [Streptomyces kunmingensis]
MPTPPTRQSAPPAAPAPPGLPWWRTVTAREESAGPRGGRGPAARPGPGADVWLAIVAVLYCIAQLALVVTQLGHGLGWDESVYVSQYDPRNPTVFFSAPRSRGTSLLTAPLVAATDSTVVLRIALAVLSSAALYAAFRVWRPLVGARTTALAALLFAGLWITMLSGAMAMPNLWVAFGAVGAVGWFLRDTGRGRHWWLAGCVAVVALFRAPDAVWLVLPLAAATLLLRERRRTLPYLAAGLVAGLAQWVVEAYIRWGGVPERLRVSSATEGDMGLHLNLGTAWRAVNGPLLCRPCTAGSPMYPGLALWWLALPLLIAAAAYVALRGRRPAAPTVVPLACAVALSVPYLLLIGYSAPRFLLPSYALLSLPLAVLLRRLRRPRPLAIAAVAVLAFQLTSQFVVLDSQVASTARTEARYVAAARGLHAMGLTPPCLVTGPRALPIGYAAGCASAQTKGNNRSTTQAELLRRAARIPTAVLTEPGHRPPKFARDWTPYELPHTRGWTAWKAPVPYRLELLGP